MVLRLTPFIFNKVLLDIDFQKAYFEKLCFHLSVI